MNTKQKISNIINQSVKVKQQLLSDEILEKISSIVNVCTWALQNGKSVYFCGNGGSAADAQHLAAELSGRFYHDRDPLPAEALHVNTSYLTAVANDYGYEFVYSRLIKAFGKCGDVLFGLSTSGKSKNIINAFEYAKSAGIYTVGLTGINHGPFNAICDETINVPSDDTPRIQEAHVLIGHIMCQLIEENYETGTHKPSQ